MDEAFVQDAENDVDRDHRRGDQKLLLAERLFILERGAGKAACKVGRQADGLRCVLKCRRRVAQRLSGREIERDCRRHELVLMIDRKRRIARAILAIGRKRRHRLGGRRHRGGARRIAVRRGRDRRLCCGTHRIVGRGARCAAGAAGCVVTHPGASGDLRGETKTLNCPARWFAWRRGCDCFIPRFSA